METPEKPISRKPRTVDFYISRVELECIRSFHKLNLDFTGKGSDNNKPRMRTVIIGKNGTCKTTLLRSIAIGLADEKDASGLVAEPVGTLVCEEEKSAEIRITLCRPQHKRGTARITTKLKSEHGEDVLEAKDYEKGRTLGRMLVCGYGAGRSIEGGDFYRTYRIIDSVYSLFKYEEPTIGTELTLRRLEDFLGTKYYSLVMAGIKRCLDLGPEDEIELGVGGGVFVSGPTIGKRIPLAGWADGYRLTLAWMLDLYAWAMRADAIDPKGRLKGILLLDEPEQHLHPSMQVDLMNRLSKLFPDLQMIVSTHSPLVTLGAKPWEIVSLERKLLRVEANSDVPDFSGYSAEDILADPELFDSAVYSSEITTKLARYRELMNVPKKKRSKVQADELKTLATELVSQEAISIEQSSISKEFQKLMKKHNL